MRLGRPPKSTARVLDQKEIRRLRERRAEGLTIAALAGLHGVTTKQVRDLTADLPPANAPVSQRHGKAVLPGNL